MIDNDAAFKAGIGQGSQLPRKIAAARLRVREELERIRSNRGIPGEAHTGEPMRIIAEITQRGAIDASTLAANVQDV